MTLDSLDYFWAARGLRPVMRKTLAMALGGVILGTITPYDTVLISSHFGRYLYWIGSVVVPALLSGMVGRLVFPYLRAHKAGALAAFVGFTAALSVPTAFWVANWAAFLEALFVQKGSVGASLAAYYGHLSTDALHYGVFYLQVWLITALLVSTISLIAERMAVAPAARASAEPEVRGPEPGRRFLDRLPPALGRELLCLSMEDHYVRAHTAEGDTLILMRLADAVAELEAMKGAQVHRSWWVAAAAVADMVRDGRSLRLRLKNGLTVPVSERRVKALRESGFLK